MKKFFAVIIAISFFLPPIAYAQERAAGPNNTLSGNVFGVFGKKMMDDDWEPSEDHTEFGILVDFQPQGFPISLAFEGLRSKDDQTITSNGERFVFSSETMEFCFGIKKYIETNSGFYPFVGGGLAIIDADAKLAQGGDAVSFGDNGFGFWFGGGAVYIYRNFGVGAYLRYSTADVTIAHIDVDAGGLHLLLMAGIHF
ncbi:MAG: hypothetical protein V1714_05655 [Pseudomonadota bacterium]